MSDQPKEDDQLSPLAKLERLAEEKTLEKSLDLFNTKEAYYNGYLDCGETMLKQLAELRAERDKQLAIKAQLKHELAAVENQLGQISKNFTSELHSRWPGFDRQQSECCDKYHDIIEQRAFYYAIKWLKSYLENK